jgi:uroporphyrin-3 C-methyltransferase
VGWLALLMVLGLAGWNGWQWWQARNTESAAGQVADARIDDLSARLETNRRQMDALSASVEEAAQQAQRMQAGTEAARTQDTRLQRDLDAISADVLGLQRRLEETRAALAAVAVRDETPGRRVELSEIAFLLRAANERLVLFGDRAGADRALSLADAQLVALDDPLYLSVRQSIAASRIALEQAPAIDTIALTQRLDQLQARVPTLALEGEAAPPSPESAEEPAPEAGLWARFKAALSGLVTVRHRADDETLFTLDDRETLRQGLWLQMESARLALLRGDHDTWATSLARARSGLSQWFDADDPGVRQSLSDLAQLEAVDLTVTQPDISTPWSLFNRLRSAPAANTPEAQPAPTGAGPDKSAADPAAGAEATPVEATVDDAG